MGQGPQHQTNAQAKRSISSTQTWAGGCRCARTLACSHLQLHSVQLRIQQGIHVLPLLHSFVCRQTVGA